MTGELLDQHYLGLPKLSHIPEGLVSHIAQSSEQLCPKCSTLDFTNYFSTEASPGGDLKNYTAHLLGAYDEILRKFFNCGFCQFVIDALACKVKGLDHAGSLLGGNNGPPNVFLTRALAGSYYNRQVRPVNESDSRNCCIGMTDISPDVGGKSLHAGGHDKDAVENQEWLGYWMPWAGRCQLLGSIHWCYLPSRGTRETARQRLRPATSERCTSSRQNPVYHGRLVGNLFFFCCLCLEWSFIQIVIHTQLLRAHYEAWYPRPILK